MAEGEVETSDFQYPIMKESPKSNGEGFIINLQNQLRTLENRVKELELENAKLSSQLSNCRCRNKSSSALSPGNGLVSRGPSFAPEEDLALSQSWLEGSRDPVIGMTPKKDTLWECITDCYGSRKPHHLPIRTTKSLQCRWNTISSAVKKLQGCVRQVELSNPSSSSELDILVENDNYNVVHGNTLIQESKKLSVDVSHEDAVGHEERPNVDGTKEFESRERSPGRIAKTMHHAPKRYVAMKIMYFGQRFYGFASQQVEPTIESEIFKALEKTRLLVCDKNESRYTRCGRTDKGVSSVGQVISLLLRSKSGDTQVSGDRKDLSPEDMCGEIDYVRVLNGVLPKDIRVISWCPVPKDFHARFGCLSRTYKYLFWRENLNLAEMEIAAMKFVGDHDFRNFCKMDAANVHNYRRHITSFEFSRCNSRSEGDELWVMTINGSAFLWHQIRCMVAVLFMIGHGLELPSVIDELLDTNRTPRKPQYVMAPELPLILQSCEFEHLRNICSPDAGQSLREHLRNEIRHYKLQAAIFQEALLSCSNTIKDRSPSSHIKKKAVHIPLMSRPTEPSYEERQAKHKARTV